MYNTIKMPFIVNMSAIQLNPTNNKLSKYPYYQKHEDVLSNCLTLMTRKGHISMQCIIMEPYIVPPSWIIRPGWSNMSHKSSNNSHIRAIYGHFLYCCCCRERFVIQSWCKSMHSKCRRIYCDWTPPATDDTWYHLYHNIAQPRHVLKMKFEFY